MASVNARIGWKALTAAEYQDEGYPFLNTPNIKGRDIDFDDVNYISEFRFQESPELKLREGDVLLAKDGSTLGIVNIVRTLPRPATVNGSIAVIRPHDVDPRFLRYSLASASVQGRIQMVKDGMGVPHLFQWDINRLPLLLPPLDEQQRIADFLDDQVARIDKAVEARRTQLGLVEELGRSAAVAEMLSGGQLDAEKDGRWFVGLPTGWGARPLRSVADVVDCKHRTPIYVDTGYPVVSPGDISPGRLDLSRCHRFVDEADYLDLADRLRRCSPGDIVYSRNASAGSAALVETEEPFTMGQDVCRIAAVGVPSLYLFHALNLLVEPQLDSVRIGSTFTRINVDQIKALRVPVGPADELQAISGRVDRLLAENDAAVTLQTTQIERLHEFNRSLISAAVSGELDVAAASGREVTV